MRIQSWLYAAAVGVAFTPFAAIADGHGANKALAIEALTQTLGKSNADAVDTFFATDYIQHNPMVADGSQGLKDMIAGMQGGTPLKMDTARVIADGDLVAFHSRYEGFGPAPLIAFDVFRIEDGKIAEHWDNMIEEQPLNPSGRSQIDGATEITDLDKTEANKAKVTDFLTRAMINHEKINFTDYISPVTYLQHNPQVADGLEGFGAFLKEMGAQGITMDYTKVHMVMGEGNFVLALSEGAFGGAPQAFYDLFRLEDGLIVEHWDVIAPMPGADAPHNEAGKF